MAAERLSADSGRAWQSWQRSARIETLAELEKLPEQPSAGIGVLATLGLEPGFETAEAGRHRRTGHSGRPLWCAAQPQGAKRPSDFISEVQQPFQPEIIVVHADHGIGRFIGLKTIEAAMGAPHDCLELRYAGDDRLFLPVENIELLSRYGSDEAADTMLDKLGGTGLAVAQGEG